MLREMLVSWKGLFSGCETSLAIEEWWFDRVASFGYAKISCARAGG